MGPAIILLSQDGCQIFWNQDFSATSVLYTVLAGEKKIFLVAPTKKNLKLWQMVPTTNQPNVSCFFLYSQKFEQITNGSNNKPTKRELFFSLHKSSKKLMFN